MDWNKIETDCKKNEVEIAFLHKEEEVHEIPENYGLKSLNCPPQIEELSAFENELFNLLILFNFIDLIY